MCAPVAHRQFVFTIPKRLRIYFRFDRRLLGELCRAAWEVVRVVLQSVSGRPDAAPAMIGAIQSFGDLIHWHPHIHALVAEGVFLPDGISLELPKLASEPFLKLWEQAVFDPLDFLAEVTQHIPEPGEHLIRYYGWYSNKKRGLRAKSQMEEASTEGNGESILGPDRKSARKAWAALIKHV